jgi:hypothetical protein
LFEVHAKSVLTGSKITGLSDSRETMAEVLEAFRDAGADHVLVDRVNPYPTVLARLRSVLATCVPAAAGALWASIECPESYAKTFRKRVLDAAMSVGVELSDVL